ncbi:MAG: PRC-barrel domain-containing protein [Gammaproteobacteria bacterium WSBS_2016_MAG_OTU1]
MPSLAEDDEYYWQDLIGLQALDVDGEILGEVCGISALAHTIFCALPPLPMPKPEILVPYVRGTMLLPKVDMSAKTIRLHWQQDW